MSVKEQASITLCNKCAKTWPDDLVLLYSHRHKKVRCSGCEQWKFTCKQYLILGALRPENSNEADD